uniref:Sulfotransfer_1 domain-containing protein n=1 Tax=Parastrongyloides trichosuri TaxID=131310 RepID=A0A0N5A6K5_PARTI
MENSCDKQYVKSAMEKYDELVKITKDNMNLHKEKDKPLTVKVGSKYYGILCTKETVESSKILKLRSDDIIITSYPKCGSTWLRQIILQLVINDYWESEIPQFLASPMIEFMGSSVVDQYPSPRVLKTHYDFDDCPKSDECKFIYIVRNPKDAIVSYYHHMTNLSFYHFQEASFEEFFNHFFSKEMEWGNYFDNVKSWIPMLDKPNVLFLVYENLKKDLPSNILKIAKFLGGDVSKKYQTVEDIKDIVEKSSFNFMKKNVNRFTEDPTIPTFIRKGTTKDWKNHLTKDQSDKVDELFKKTFANTSLEYLWLDEMKF